MSQNFISTNIDITQLQKDNMEQSLLIENNISQIEAIQDFLHDSAVNLLLVNGFQASGKTQLLNLTEQIIDDSVLYLNYACFETTTLDDMLLFFYTLFKKFENENKILHPRIKTDKFTQKVNAYFQTIEKPILIIIDSYDSIIKEHKEEIINFVKHLQNYENIKIILCSRGQLSSKFEDIEYKKITVLPLSKNLYEKYLKTNDIKQIGVISNELYKLTKGYYKIVSILINIITLEHSSLSKFLEDYSKSFMPFDEYLTNSMLEYIDPTSIHLFRLLTMMRIPIHIRIIEKLNLYSKEKIDYFVKIGLLEYKDECLFIKEKYREIIESQVVGNVLIKLHKACIDLYNTQLPLKPLERELILSRQTMRNEIEYHSRFIPQKPVFTPKPSPVTPHIERPLPQSSNQEDKTTKEKINEISFIIEDEAILDNIADSINEYINTTNKFNQLEQESLSLSITKILNLAKNEENFFNYKQAISLYQNALSKKNDEDFYTFLPVIYTKLGYCYKQLSMWYESLEYYTQAQDFYYNISDLVKTCEVKFEIANIYYNMYKLDNARFVLNELNKIPELPSELKVKIKMKRAELGLNKQEATELLKEAVNMVDIDTSKTILSELYYKYAILLDDQDDTNEAAKMYKACIDLGDNPQVNPYLSQALQNFAQLYDEVGASQAATKYYKESIYIDQQTKNISGLYSSNFHLAEIYLAKDEEKALEYMNNASEYAKQTKDIYNIIEIETFIGDYYYTRQNKEKAFVHYNNAYKAANDKADSDTIKDLKYNLDKIKKDTTDELWNELNEKYKNK